MSALETSVQTLASALDALENRLSEKLADASADADAVEATQRQARAARAHLHEASTGLAASLAELRALIEAPQTDPMSKESDANGAS